MPRFKLTHYKQLDLRTGETKLLPIINGPENMTLKLYLKTINSLNEEAHTYGVVYLLTPIAAAAVDKELA